jgi:acetoacetyl-CoA reductase
MNKIALVTGGIGGIGTAICQQLFVDGYTVIATYRSKNIDKALTWHKLLFDESKDVHIFPVNVASFESCDDMVRTVTEKVGPIAILVNNAGITDDASLKNMSSEQWRSVLNNNLDSVFNMSKAVFHRMCEMKWGRIVNISSINGQKGQFGQVNYAAAKAGIYGFTKSLAQEGAKKGVTVNSISPGYIATEMVNKLSANIIESIIVDIPVGRLGKPEEIANAVSFLVGEHSGFITGSNISINGGQYM